MLSALAALVLSAPLSNQLAPTSLSPRDAASEPAAAVLGERRRGMKEEVEPLVAAFEAAMASGDAPQVVAALGQFTPFNNDDIVVLCGRALRYAASPAEVAAITKDQIEVKDDEARKAPRIGYDEEPLTDEEFEKLIESKRAEVIEYRCYELAGTVAAAAATQLGDIVTKKALKTLVDALDDPLVSINPFAHKSVVDALMYHDEGGKQVEDALCDLLGTFPHLDRSRLASEEHPQLPRTTPYTMPLIRAGAYFARRGCTRKAVVEKLIDGLMYGADENDKNTQTIDLGNGMTFDIEFNLDDIDDSSIKAVARECSRALQVITKQRYAPCRPSAQEAARVWLAKEGKKAGIK
jgi:hypothetical protein